MHLNHHSFIFLIYVLVYPSLVQILELNFEYFPVCRVICTKNSPCFFELSNESNLALGVNHVFSKVAFRKIQSEVIIAAVFPLNEHHLDAPLSGDKHMSEAFLGMFGPAPPNNLIWRVKLFKAQNGLVKGKLGGQGSSIHGISEHLRFVLLILVATSTKLVSVVPNDQFGADCKNDKLFVERYFSLWFLILVNVEARNSQLVFLFSDPLIHLARNIQILGRNEAKRSILCWLSLFGI